MADEQKMSEFTTKVTPLIETDFIPVLVDDGLGGFTNGKVLKSMLLGYKSYHFAPTQTTVTTTSGLLVIGKTYIIASVLGADDFTNVGFVAINTPFVASGTTPTVWASSTVVKNVTDSAPVNNELINDFGGTPVLTYVGPGRYDLTITGAFTGATKVFCFMSPILDYTTEVDRIDDNTIRIFVGDFSGNGQDGIINGIYVIEVRKYY